MCDDEICPLVAFRHYGFEALDKFFESYKRANEVLSDFLIKLSYEVGETVVELFASKEWPYQFDEFDVIEEVINSLGLIINCNKKMG
jgi:hypothetical protein